MIHISQDVLDGDEFSKKLVSSFFTKYLDKFCGKRVIKSKVFERLVGDISKACKYETNIYDECTLELLDEITAFTKEYLSKNNDVRMFVDHYHEEWEGKIPQCYPIAQYNAMKVKSTIDTLVRMFVREQLFTIGKVVHSKQMKEAGVSSYITSKAFVNDYIFDPDPKFEGMEKGKHYMSTRQPDINILAPYFEKYKIERFLEQPDGSKRSRHSGWDYPRVLDALNTLKYTHMNLGAEKRRRTLDISSKQVHHVDTLKQSNVTGNWARR